MTNKTYRKRTSYAGKTRAQALWDRVDKSGDCWEWQGTPDKDGYGVFTYRGRPYRAHRAAWIVTFGEIPRGLQVCHSCDNPACVRPEHLMLGTHRSNVVDRVRKGRSATGDRSGSRIHRDRVREGIRKWCAEHPERHARGERAGMAKLTQADVISIREMYRSGARQVDIAARFQITQAHVSEIVLRKVWKHVPDDLCLGLYDK
jgi:HNH endonuclease